MVVSVTASRFHEQVYGIRASVTSGAATAPINRAVCISPIGVDQPIFPSDILSVQVNGTASDDAIVTITVYYPDIPGIHARLATCDYVRQNTKNLVGINTNLTPGDGVAGTAGAPNAADNRLHAHTDYAPPRDTSHPALPPPPVSRVGTGHPKGCGPGVGPPQHEP